MKTTANYGLKKPDGTDLVDIDNFNYNADIIDTELAKRALKTDIPAIPVTSVNGKTGAVTVSKSDVGLGSVNNWGATTAVNSTSTTTYATASAVKQAYDKALEAFQSASNGKEAIATALTGQGVASSPSESFQSLADKIKNMSSSGPTSYMSFSDNENLDVTGTVEDKIKNLSIKSEKSIGTKNTSGKYDINIEVSNGLVKGDSRYQSYVKKITTPKPLIGSSALNKYNEIKFNESKNVIEFIQRVDEGVNIINNNNFPIYNNLFNISGNGYVAVIGNKLYYKIYDNYNLCSFDVSTKTFNVGSRVGVYNYGLYYYKNKLYLLDDDSIMIVDPNDLTKIESSISVKELNSSAMTSNGDIFCLKSSVAESSLYVYNIDSGSLTTFNLSSMSAYFKMEGCTDDIVFLTSNNVLYRFDKNTKLLTVDSEINYNGSKESINLIENDKLYIYKYTSTYFNDYDRIFDLKTKTNSITVLPSSPNMYSNTKTVIVGDYYYSIGQFGIQVINRKTNIIDVSRTMIVVNGYLVCNAQEYLYITESSYSSNNEYAIYNLKTGKKLTTSSTNRPSDSASYGFAYKNTLVFKSYSYYDSYRCSVFNPLYDEWVSITQPGFNASASTYFGFARDKIVCTYNKNIYTWDIATKKLLSTVASADPLFASNHNVTVEDRYIYYVNSNKLYKLDVDSCKVSYLCETSVDFISSRYLNYKDMYILFFNGTILHKYDIKNNTWTNIALPTSLYYPIGCIGDSIILKETSSSTNKVHIYNIDSNSVSSCTFSEYAYFHICDDKLYMSIRATNSSSGFWRVKYVDTSGANASGSESITNLGLDCNWNSFKHRTQINVLESNTTTQISADLKIEK